MTTAPASITEAISQTVSPEERRRMVDAAATDFVSHGWRLENRSDYQAVFVKGHRPNHILHLLLTIFTGGLWGLFVWLPLSIFGGEKRQIVSVDEYGKRTGH
jgi:hypothetical protein